MPSSSLSVDGSLESSLDLGRIKLRYAMYSKTAVLNNTKRECAQLRRRVLEPVFEAGALPIACLSDEID